MELPIKENNPKVNGPAKSVHQPIVNISKTTDTKPNTIIIKFTYLDIFDLLSSFIFFPFVSQYLYQLLLLSFSK
jgi:hypothetical protein